MVRAFDGVAIVASVLIVVSLSADIIMRKTYRLGPGVAELQLAVCIVFMMDFLVRTIYARRPQEYALGHLWMLLVSVPYLNLLHLLGPDYHIDKYLYIVLKALPMVRGMVGVYDVVRLAAPSRVAATLWSYVVIIVLLTYMCALLFFSAEEGVNPAVGDFGDALWWAGLNVTTVGANLFATTALGKVLTVVLPALGMVLFPLFTVYVTHIVTRRPTER